MKLNADFNLTASLILCGYTGSGKTTIGKLLAEKLKRPFYDTDQMLTEKFQMTIPEIFARGGEALFRDMEHEIAKQVCSLPPSVISTGGGMLTFERNGDLLSQHGIIIYIDRPFEDCYRGLALQTERPLLKNHTKEELFQSYLVRAEKYKKYAAYIIKNDSTPEDAAEKIIFCCTLTAKITKL